MTPEIDAPILVAIASVPFAVVTLNVVKDRYAARATPPDSLPGAWEWRDQMLTKRDDRWEAKRFSHIFRDASYLASCTTPFFGIAAGLHLSATAALPKIGYAVLVCDLVMIAFRVVLIWRSRREVAFSEFYASPQVYPWHQDRDAVWQLFEVKNWMRPWGWSDRNWRRRIRFPVLVRKESLAAESAQENEQPPLG